MLAMIKSCVVLGLTGHDLLIEVDVSAGMPSFDIVGLPDAAVRESKERVRTALKNSGLEFPLKKVIVNLAPANLKKEGSLLDLPIAVGILAATEQVPFNRLLAVSAFCGELSLEGTIRPIKGALPIADHLSQNPDLKALFLPKDNAPEAAMIEGINCLAAADLKQVVRLLRREEEIEVVKTDILALLAAESIIEGPDMAEVKGQEGVKRVLEIAAAGGHNALMIGAPGSGKTMMARRLPGIMPPLTMAESLEATKIYSIAGLLPVERPLIIKRPFRSPHHGASAASIIGGGTNPKPGEISLAHNGILFMDELPEFSRDVLEALRQPLEDKMVSVARVMAKVDYPANLQLIAAMNPCPCGFYGDSQKECSCTNYQRQRYLQKISGPLLDRIDLHIEVPRVHYQDLNMAENQASKQATETSDTIQKRVIRARKIQLARFKQDDIINNAAMQRRHIEQFCRLDDEGSSFFAAAFRNLNLSGRAHDRLLKVARTIADLASSPQIKVDHIAEALQYRSLDREQLD